MDYHVSKAGSDQNPGTVEQPFLTIKRAADLALPGDTITVHEGVYREWVNPKNGGTETARITYQAAPGEQVTITGAEVITNWEPVGAIHKATIPNGIFGEYNPYEKVIHGDWFFDNDKNFHTGEVYLNGKSMYESLTLDGVLHPVPTPNSCDQAGSLYTWYVEVSDTHTTIWANFQGADPNAALIEMNVRPCVFWPELTGRAYITVRGFTLKQAATQWAPPTTIQTGLIGPHWSRGWIIEDNIISDSKNTAISLGKEISTGDNEWTLTGEKGGTQREREVIFRALHHAGWHQDNVGGHIIRRNHIKDCEQAGIVGHLGSAFCLIEDNHIQRIHYKRQWHGAEVGGIKFHAAIDTLIQGNTIHDAYPGVVAGLASARHPRLPQCFYDNSAEDFMAEVCHGPYIVDHNLFLSKWAVKDMSTGGAFIHNLFLGKIAACVELERYTPYHFPHHTAVYGLANVLGGDNRFYNNIFLRTDNEEVSGLSNFWSGAVMMDGVPGNATFYQTPVGLSQYDSYPGPNDPAPEGMAAFTSKLPIYAAGNVYLGGAEPFCKEDSPSTQGEVTVEILNRDTGQVRIALNGLPVAQAITTEMLGKAYQAEMAYENPDGSPIIWQDFTGKPRHHATPGPFEANDVKVFNIGGKGAAAQ